MDKKRLDHVDFLRAVGIIGVIAIHVLTNNLTNPLNKFLWNFLSFTVVIFIYCSGYVLALAYKNRLNNSSEITSWLKKRVLRLLVPFYIYLSIHFALWFLFPNFFGGLSLNKSLIFILQSFLLFGGTNTNWLPLLFLQLSLLFPFLMFGISNRKFLTSYVLFALGVTLFFTVMSFPYAYYRHVMWVPWSLVFVLSISIAGKEKEDNKNTFRRYILGGLLSSIIFFILFLFWQQIGKPLNLIDNKYPPNLYYLSNGLMLTFLSLIISRLKIFQNNLIKTIYMFISKNSYQLFFIHYIILDLTFTTTRGITFWSNAGIQFSLVLFVSLTVCFLLKKMGKLFISPAVQSD